MCNLPSMPSPFPPRSQTLWHSLLFHVHTYTTHRIHIHTLHTHTNTPHNIHTHSTYTTYHIYTHVTHSPHTSTHYSYPVLYFIKLPHCDRSGLCFNVILTERPLLRLCKYAPICPSHYSPSLHCTLLLFLMSLIVVIDLCVICLPHEIPPFMG